MGLLAALAACPARPFLVGSSILPNPSMAYCTAEELKLELQGDDEDFDRDDAIYEAVVVEASAAIDQYCHRSFEVPGAATTRYFSTTLNGLEIYQLDDIASATDLVIATDSSDSGSYSTVTNWFSEVDNLTGAITGIRFTSATYPSHQGRRNVRVTARFGWPETPTPVHRAAVILARRLYSRKDSVAGVLNFGDLGGVRIPKIDPDVASLLNPFVKYDGMIA